MPAVESTRFLREAEERPAAEALDKAHQTVEKGAHRGKEERCLAAAAVERAQLLSKREKRLAMETDERAHLVTEKTACGGVQERRPVTAVAKSARLQKKIGERAVAKPTDVVRQESEEVTRWDAEECHSADSERNQRNIARGASREKQPDHRLRRPWRWMQALCCVRAEGVESQVIE